MNVVVINLTRLGDLLQSQALIDDLHIAGHNVDLICLDNFAEGAALLRHVRQIWPLPGAQLLARIADNWPQALGLVNDFAKKVRGHADCILNITPGSASRLLAHQLALDGARVLGLDLDNYGFGLDHGLWASFMSVAARRRANSPFNLSDMWRMMAQPLTSSFKGSFKLKEVPEDAKAWGENFLATPKIPARCYVAFQLGASENRRRWPVQYFRELGERLWQHKICPVLVGSASEQPLAQRYATGASHPFVNAVGQTSLPQLAALLSGCRLLVTNDTGTMHLASGLGLPSLAFFLATAQPWDTGPLLPGCCCLEPALACHPCPFGTQCSDDERCRRQISVDTAARLVSRWLEAGQWQDFDIKDARVWRTAIDQQGYSQLEALSANAFCGPGAWHAWWRSFWRQLFDDLSASASGAFGNSPANFANLPPIRDISCVNGLEQGANLLQTIAELAPATQLQSQPLGKIFLRNCERLQELWAKEPHLAVLSDFWWEFRSNQGDNLRVFSQQCLALTTHIKTLAKALTAQAA